METCTRGRTAVRANAKRGVCRPPSRASDSPTVVIRHPSPPWRRCAPPALGRANLRPSDRAFSAPTDSPGFRARTRAWRRVVSRRHWKAALRCHAVHHLGVCGDNYRRHRPPPMASSAMPSIMAVLPAPTLRQGGHCAAAPTGFLGTSTFRGEVRSFPPLFARHVLTIAPTYLIEPCWFSMRRDLPHSSFTRR